MPGPSDSGCMAWYTPTCVSASCNCMSASKVVRTLKVAHACKCQVPEHSKQDIPEDLKDLLKRVDNTLQQLDTVCDRYLDGENEDQLEMIIEACQRSFH